ncbi:MAG: hypothetical protein OEZ00_05100 [Dehalococcoidia bacterium]|nr:hypothetical protein [Dehalococcoidia bacterium]
MRHGNLNFQASCKTTAMGIMPHTNVDRALELTLSLDIPFWPQLPNVSFYEDMYVQTSQNFPGIAVDLSDEKISFNTAKFEEELNDYSQRMAEPETFILSRKYSAVYHRFLAEALQGYPAIRGQVTGPVSCGFRVVDENSRPIIYDEGVRALLFDFIQRKANIQYRQLKERNSNAFVWLDEPGLGWVFSGLTGYNDVQAKRDYQSFLAGFDGPKALHLCASVNLPYLLGLGVELLSFDAYQIELLPKGYANAVADFLRSDGIISWGIVPIDSERLSKETPETLASLLSSYWAVVAVNTGLSAKGIAEQALIAPARCCLKNIGQVGASDDTVACETRESPNLTVEEQLVERAFAYLGTLSEILKNKFHL